MPTTRQKQPDEKAQISKLKRDNTKGCKAFIKQEKVRYERKGYGIVFAALITVAFFYVVPVIGAQYWPKILAFKEKNKLNYTQFYLGWAMTQSFVIKYTLNLVYYVFYHYEFPFIERYKSNSEPWPWLEDPKGWRTLIWKSVWLSNFNSLAMIPLVFIIPYKIGISKEFSLETEDLPSSTTLAINILFCMICEDFSFYWSHRTLHWRVIYPYIHKIHHEYNTTVGFAAEYAHPIEYIFGFIVPMSIGPLIIGPRMHFLTLMAWYAVRECESLDGHCGYEFSFSPYRLVPFSGSSEYHDWHHSANVGNYGSFFTVWDTIFGTNRDFFEMLNDRQKDTKTKVKAKDDPKK